MPKSYTYNCKFTTPNGEIITLNNIKTQELINELNTLLTTHFMWQRKITPQIMYNLRCYSTNPQCKRTLNSLLKKIIHLEIIQ